MGGCKVVSVNCLLLNVQLVRSVPSSSSSLLLSSWWHQPQKRKSGESNLRVVDLWIRSRIGPWLMFVTSSGFTLQLVPPKLQWPKKVTDWTVTEHTAFPRQLNKWSPPPITPTNQPTHTPCVPATPVANSNCQPLIATLFLSGILPFSIPLQFLSSPSKILYFEHFKKTLQSRSIHSLFIMAPLLTTTRRRKRLQAFTLFLTACLVISSPLASAEEKKYLYRTMPEGDSIPVIDYVPPLNNLTKNNMGGSEKEQPSFLYSTSGPGSVARVVEFYAYVF